MTKEKYLKVTDIRDKYRDRLQDVGVPMPVEPDITLEKKELMILLEGCLSRGDVEIQFKGTLTKMPPKLKADGSRSIEFSFATPFDEGLLGRAGHLYGSGVNVFVELNVNPGSIVKTPDQKEAEAKAELDKTQGVLGLDTPTIHQAGEELISSTCPSCGGNCYRGESNEEPCEECGATGVVYRAKNLDKRVDCATCKGAGNVEGLDLVWGPCTDCKGAGKVEVPEAVPALLLMFDNIEAWKAELDAKALKLWPDNGSLSETSTDEQWVEFYGGRSTDAVIEDELANPEKGESSEEVPGEVGPEGEDPNESDRAEEPQAS